MAYRYSVPQIRPIQPISPFGKSAIGLGSSISFFNRPSSSKSAMSPTQLLKWVAASQTHHRSFGDRLKGVGLGVAHPFEVAMHELLRTSTAVSEAAYSGQQARKAHKPILDRFAAELHGLVRGFKHPGARSMSDVLKNDPEFGNYFKRHKIQAGAAGLTLDVVTDPLTYATFGTGAAARAGEEGAYNASRFALEAGHYAAKGKPNIAAIPELKTAADTLDAAGPRYGMAAALARSRIKAIDALARVPHNTKSALKTERIIASAVTEAHVAERAAWAEHFNNTLRPIQVGFKMGKLDARLNTRVPLPKVGEALVKSNLPVVSNLAGKLRQGFGAGRGDWERALRVTRKHVVEERADSYVVTAKGIAKEMPKLSQKEALQAWHMYEKPGLIRKNAAGLHVLDAKAVSDAVKAGKLSDKQAKFLKQWDQWTNIMFDLDKAAGVEYTHIAEKTGGGYVPHIFENDRTGLHVPNDTVRQFLKKAGYTRRRKQDMTLSFINHLHEQGKLADKLELDPYKLMVKMGRQRANAQADQAIYHVVTDGFGVPAKLPHTAVDKEALAEAQGKLAKVQQEIHDITTGKVAPQGTYKSSKAQTQMKRLIAREKKWELRVAAAKQPVTKMVANPEAHGGLVTLKNIDGKVIRNADGQAIKIEPEGAAALNRYERILRDPKERLQFASAWQKAMGRWKVLVTAVNIGGYRIRNTMSDFWNMYLSGVPVHGFAPAAGMAVKFLHQVEAGNPKAMAEFMHLYHSGALSGVFGGDVSLLAKELELGGGGAATALKRGRLLKAASRGAQDFNRKAENWGRLTHYMYRTRIEGMSSSKALEKVRQAHFDYEDLTPTEQSIKSKFIPFYTWTRKDVPYQLSQLIEHPGRYATFPKIALESEKAAGTQGDIPPGYLSDTLAFKVPELGYYTPQVGVSDVARFQSPKAALKNVVNMQNPALKAVAELSLNKQFFTGQPIKDPTGHARTPVSSWLAPLLAQVPGTDVGKTSRMVRGKRVFGQGANPYAMYFVNQLPLSRYLATSFNPITRGKKGLGPELSYWLGQSTTQPDPQLQLMMEQLALEDKVNAQVKKLRDEGKYPQAKHSISPNEKKILDELRRQLRRR